MESTRLSVFEQCVNDCLSGVRFELRKTIPVVLKFFEGTLCVPGAIKGSVS